jgi:hypothetical protein
MDNGELELMMLVTGAPVWVKSSVSLPVTSDVVPV